MRFRRFVAVGAVLAALCLAAFGMSSCAGPGPLSPQVSAHFRTARGAFMVDVTSGTVRYVMAYEVIAPFTDPVIARIRFQNPRASQPDYVVERLLAPNERRLDVRSPPLAGMPAGAYEVLLVAVHAITGEELGRHLQTVQLPAPVGSPPSGD